MKEKIAIALVVILIGIGSFLYLKKIQNPPVSVSDISSTTPSTPSDPKYIIVSSRISETYGKYLTDANGRTLYVFADDKLFESNCNGECLSKWPVYEYNNINLSNVTDQLSKNVGITKRKDGWQQFSYLRKPVYYYAGDIKPGDINGVDDKVVGSKWSLIKLD